MKTIKKTVAQALVDYLTVQYVSRDESEHRLFGGCLGIFGHGNVAGLGLALQSNASLPYIPFRNEQAMVHAAVAYAKAKNRMGILACTSSIGPGATNMITGAALATINRLPVLLLPGDIFAKRHVAPVLQQLESLSQQDISVNDCFKPVSRYWDRIERPEQLVASLPQAVKVLTSPAMTGAVTLSLPQDVQAEAYDFPSGMFQKRLWRIERIRADRSILSLAIDRIRASQRPVIIAGGGVLYSGATNALLHLIEQTGIPVAVTMAGKSSLAADHPLNLGSCGVTGTAPGVIIPEGADLVIGIGTRYSDFTTSSKTLFQHPGVQFININVADVDDYKLGALAVKADAKVCLEELAEALQGWKVTEQYLSEVGERIINWKKEILTLAPKGKETLTQAEVIEAVNDVTETSDIIVAASGSLPGDLHKLWRTYDPLNFHMEYGYSCMGYEIAGALGVKMAHPDREVIAMVGDGSYLMMSQEILTSLQEEKKLIVVLVNNFGFNSIGSLSRSVGGKGFGTRMVKDIKKNSDSSQTRPEDLLRCDFVSNAKSLGAEVLVARNSEVLRQAIKKARQNTHTTLIYTECDRYQLLPDFSWWEVPIAEQEEPPEVLKARKKQLENKLKQRPYDHL